MIIKKKKQQPQEVIAEELPVQEEQVEDDGAIDLFNLDNIDFKQCAQLSL